MTSASFHKTHEHSCLYILYTNFCTKIRIHWKKNYAFFFYKTNHLYLSFGIDIYIYIFWLKVYLSKNKTFT